VGDGLDRDNTIAARTLALVVALDLRVVTHGKVGRFDKRPGQIAIAVLGVAPSFTLAVADLFTATQRQ